MDASIGGSTTLINDGNDLHDACCITHSLDVMLNIIARDDEPSCNVITSIDGITLYSSSLLVSSF